MDYSPWGCKRVRHNLATKPPSVAQRYRLFLKCRTPGFDSWIEKIPLEKEMATHSIQYSCLENSMDREAWQATVYGVSKELDMT